MRSKVLIASGLLVTALMLSGCGFRPLYAEDENGLGLDDRLATVELDEIRGSHGREFKLALGSQMYPAGRSAAAPTRFLLNVRLKAEREALAIQPDASITRYDYNIWGRYHLVEVGSKEIVHRGIAQAKTSYNVVESQFATLAARKDAQDRAIRSLSEEIRMRIALYLRTGNAPEGTEPLVRKK